MYCPFKIIFFLFFIILNKCTYVIILCYLLMALSYLIYCQIEQSSCFNIRIYEYIKLNFNDLLYFQNPSCNSILLVSQKVAQSNTALLIYPWSFKLSNFLQHFKLWQLLKTSVFNQKWFFIAQKKSTIHSRLAYVNIFFVLFDRPYSSSSPKLQRIH